MAIHRITVMIPMRNEVEHVDALVRTLSAQDFGGEIEIFVADGGSTDGSVARLRSAATREGVDVTVVDNPSGWVSHGLNECIRRASGDLLVRLDCHSLYPREYLRRCAELSHETGAWNVGGAVVAGGRTPSERAVACAMNSPFGGIGWTRLAANGAVAEVDTVTYGAFRPEAFQRAGLFDESLVRNQDDEFNIRLRLAGGRIIMDPKLRIRYTPRGAFGGLYRQYHDYGRWKVPVMLKHRRVLSARSLAPLAFVASLATLGATAFVSRRARRLLMVEVGAYAAGATVFAVQGVREARESPLLLPRVVAAFTVFHVAYGLGSVEGWARAGVAAARRARARRSAP